MCFWRIAKELSDKLLDLEDGAGRASSGKVLFCLSSTAAADDYKSSETWRLRKFKKEYFKRTLTRQMSGLQVESRKTLFRTRMSELPKCDMNEMKKMAISTVASLQLYLNIHCWKCWAIFKLYENFSKVGFFWTKGRGVINVRKFLKLYSLKLRYNFTNCPHDGFNFDNKHIGSAAILN